MSTTRQLRGLVVPHRRDYANWRLRAFREKRDNHPIDPAWELGQYRECHPGLREKVCRDFQGHRYIIFDTVYDRVTKLMVIRSAFEVSAVRGKRLIFHVFWFCDGTPIISPSPRMKRSRCGKSLDPDKTEELLETIESSGQYGKYEVPTKKPPASISQQDWDAMIRAGKMARSC
jgi:hypothetical protein